MKYTAIVLACLIGIVPFAAGAGEVIGTHELDVPFMSLGGKKIQITAFDDPKVGGVTCHVSDVAKTGMATFLSDDPSNASIACRQTGPIVIQGATEDKPWGDLNIAGENVFGATKGWFKKLTVRRWIDVKRKVLVYVVFTPKWGEDSNKNVISTVAMYGVK